MQAVANAIIEQLQDLGFRANVTSAPAHDRGEVWIATRARHVHRCTGPTQYEAIATLAESCGIELEDG